MSRDPYRDKDAREEEDDDDDPADVLKPIPFDDSPWPAPCEDDRICARCQVTNDNEILKGVDKAMKLFGTDDFVAATEVKLAWDRDVFPELKRIWTLNSIRRHAYEHMRESADLMKRKVRIKFGKLLDHMFDEVLSESTSTKKRVVNLRVAKVINDTAKSVFKC
jgi:hypothetical protein